MSYLFTRTYFGFSYFHSLSLVKRARVAGCTIASSLFLVVHASIYWVCCGEGRVTRHRCGEVLVSFPGQLFATLNRRATTSAAGAIKMQLYD